MLEIISSEKTRICYFTCLKQIAKEFTMNHDPKEVNKFDSLSTDWWQKQGAFKTLHDINPLRIKFITDQMAVANKKIIDIGCGGGILTASLAIKEAAMTGIDLSTNAIHCAKKHADEQGLTVDYQVISTEEMAVKFPESFDIVICMELLEHVPNPASLIKACSDLCKPGGQLFFSTINRNPKAYLLAVIAAEYLLKMLPQGTHDYKKFITPAELEQYCRQAKLIAKHFTGLNYNPLTKQYKLSENISINYLLHCVKNV